MTIFGIDESKIVNANLKVLIIPVVSFLVLMVLAAFLLTDGYPRVSSVYTEIQELEEQNAKLQEKLEVLREVRAENYPGGVSTAALPNDDPVLLMMFQARSAAFGSGVELERLEVGSRASSESLSNFPINLTINTDNLGVVINYLNSFEEIAPVSRLASVSIEQGPESVTTNAELVAYWSVFPERLPAISDPVEGLTPAEKDLLSQLTELDTADFVRLTPNQPQTRNNPFAVDSTLSAPGNEGFEEVQEEQ